MARFSFVLFLLIGLCRAEGSNSSNCFSMFEAVLGKKKWQKSLETVKIWSFAHFIFKISEKGYEPYRFVIHGILLAIVVIFGLVSNLISIFIFTRPEMRSPLNLILTGRIRRIRLVLWQSWNFIVKQVKFDSIDFYLQVNILKGLFVTLYILGLQNKRNRKGC